MIMTQGGAAAALLLADSWFPAGNHAHSGAMEAAVASGAVTDLASAARFLRGRLATAGATAAGLAAAACARAPDGIWARLDAEADARTPSPAQRAASRRQGRTLLRSARAAWPAPWLDVLSRAPQAPPHHPIVLGAAAAAAGCGPQAAALAAAYLAVTGPASAAVRLLALDPIAVSAAAARLADEIEQIAAAAAARAAGPLDELPFPSSPALDLLAEAHARAEVRLFAS